MSALVFGRQGPEVQIFSPRPMIPMHSAFLVGKCSYEFHLRVASYEQSRHMYI